MEVYKLTANRDATSTIIGYYYQFDYSILQILKAKEGDSIHIEGIEDVDISDIDKSTAIQCKYYAGTKYNHSVISPAIRFMLAHFAKNKDEKKQTKYMLYGYYAGDQDKLPDSISIDFAKENFFTYTKQKNEYKEHETLGLNDQELETFLGHLTIDINALEFESQNKEIIETIKTTFKCNITDAEHYYNNSLRVIKRLATQSAKEDRVVTKNDFLSEINNKEELFNFWYIQARGIETYCKNVKRKYFSSPNLSPFSRFFLIDCSQQYSEVDLKTLLVMISAKMSRLSKRDQDSCCCPYVLLYGLDSEALRSIKQLLNDEEILTIDGHPFKDSNFSCKSICTKPNYYNKIQLKIVNEFDNLSDILNHLTDTREIYQFYTDKPFYENDHHKHIKIPVTSINDLKQII